MPGPLRGQLFFAEAIGESRLYGWTETHYLVTAADLRSALTDLTSLAQKRVRMLGSGVVLNYMRVSDDNVFRDSQITSGLVPLNVGEVQVYNRAFAEQTGDFATSILLVRMQGVGDQLRRSLYLSGNPDAVQVINEQTPLNQAWNRAFNEWKDLVTGGRYGFKVIDRAAVAAAKPVIGVDPGTGVLNIVSHGFIPINPVTNRPNAVRVSGVTGTFDPATGRPIGNSPNGRWYFTVLDANHIQLSGYVPAGFILVRPGRAYVVNYVITSYTAAIPRRFGERRRGRPFDQPHGRRRNLVRRS